VVLHVRRVGSVGQKQEQGTASHGGRARRDCKQRVGKGVGRAAWRKGKVQRGEEWGPGGAGKLGGVANRGAGQSEGGETRSGGGLCNSGEAGGRRWTGGLFCTNRKV